MVLHLLGGCFLGDSFTGVSGIVNTVGRSSYGGLVFSNVVVTICCRPAYRKLCTVDCVAKCFAFVEIRIPLGKAGSNHWE